MVVEIEGVVHVISPSPEYNTPVPDASYHLRKNPEGGVDTTLNVTGPGPQRLPLEVVGWPLTHGGGSSSLVAYELVVTDNPKRRTPANKRQKCFIVFMTVID